MAKDFRAGQVRTTQIIGSGSDPNKPSILIVSASDSPSFNGEAMDSSALLTSVGSDVFMFVTGSKSHSHGSGLQGVTLFGGDVVISGTMFAEHLIAEVEATTTGSLSVSGSLVVSQSATIYEGLSVNASRETGAENDFSVYASTTKALFVDATGNAAGAIALVTDKGSSETITVTNTQGTTDGSDDAGAIELSAAAGGIGLAWADSKTLWAEGGDVMIVANENKSDAIKLHADAGSSQTISVINDEGTSESAIKIEAGAGGVDIDAAAGKNVTIAGGQVSISGLDDGVNSVSLGTNAGTSATVAINNVGGTSENSININSTAGGIDINAASTKDISLNAGQVLILSGGGVTSYNEAAGSDVSFYVSGSRNKIGSYGASVFGGDLLVSGILNAFGSDSDLPAAAIGNTSGAAGIGSDAHMWVSGSVGSRGTSTRGTSIFGGDVVVSGSLTDANGDPITGGVSSGTFNVPAVGEFVTTASVALAGGLGFNYTADTKGADAHFFVSGAIGKREDSSHVGTTIFGGDIVASGAFYLDNSSQGLSDYHGVRLLNDGTITDSNSYFTVNMRPANNPAAAGGASATNIQNRAGSINIGIGTGSLSQVPHRLSISEMGNSNNKSFLVASGAHGGQVLILSGGGATSTNITDASDVSFYVSGTVGGKDTTGTSVFGGDVLTSGSLFAVNGISGSLTTLVDGTAYLVAGTGITLTTGTNGAITIDSTAGGGGSDGAGWFAPSNGIITTTGSVYFGVSGGTTAPDITFGSDGAAVFNEQGASVDFRIESNNKENALFVDGSTDQVLILSGGGATSYNEAAAADVNFYVSGTAGSRGTSARGTTVFGGDAVISGALYVSTPGVGQDVIFYGEDSSAIGFQWDADGGDHGKLTLGQDDHGIDFQVFGEDSNNYVNWQQASNTLSLYTPQGAINTKGNVIFDVSSQGWDFTVNTNNKTGIFVDGSEDQVLILSGGGATSINEAAGSDVSFYVSGSRNKMGSYGTSVFGGDLFTSGVLYAYGSDSGLPAAAIGNIDGASGIGKDAHMWVSGTIGSRGTSVRGTSIFGGDTAFSGSAHYLLGLSGSLTKLSDGTSYLIAGSNVTITTGTNGAVTIASTGGGAADAVGWTGPANQIIATTGSLTIGTTSATPGDADIFFSSAGGAVFNEQGASVDFRVESDNKENALLVDGSTDQVLILSGGGATSYNEAAGADVNFYVSGTSSSKGTATRGTSVFGGDVHISGSFTSDGTNFVDVSGTPSNNQLAIWTDANTVEGDSNFSWSGTLLDVQGDANLNGTVVINQGGNDKDFRVETANKSSALQVDGGTDQVLLFSGSLSDASGYGSSATDPDPRAFTDTNFFVSGSIGSIGTSTKGTSVFGGDVVISGSLFGGSPLSVGGDLAVSGSVILSGTSPTEITGSLSVTGSMSVTGSLTVSGSDTFSVFGPSVFNEGGTSDSDFRIESDSKTHAVFVDTSTDQVLILSGGGVTSYNEATGADVNFYVSGTIGGKGAAARGISVFGGDLCSSGSVYATTVNATTVASTAVTGSLTKLHDGTSYLIAGSNVTITSGTNGSVTIASSGGGAADAVGWTGPANQIIATTGSLNIGTTSATPGDADIYFSSAGGAVFNEQGASVDFRVESDNKENALLVDGSTDQVLILSGGGATSYNEATGADVNFYVSGTADNAGSANRGTSVFGGDLYVSGGFYLGTTSDPKALSVDHTTDRVSWFGGGSPNSRMLINNRYGSALDISSSGVVVNEIGASTDFRVESNIKENALLVDGSTDQVLILSGGGATSYNEAAAADVNFYVSGTVGSQGTSTRGVSVFGGDVVISGSADVLGTSLNVGGSDGVDISDGEVSIKNAGSVSNVKFYCESSNAHYTQLQSAPHSEYASDVTLTMPPVTGRLLASTDAKIEEYLYHTADLNTYLQFSTDKVQLSAGGNVGLTLDEGSTDKVEVGSNYDQVLILSGGGATSYNETSGADVAFYVSGTVGSKGTAARGTSVFGGDVCTSGTLYPSTMLSNRISGSLTHLTDGSSYLIAGSNVTITTGSSGAVTIASSGGGAADAVGWSGPANQIIVTTGSLSIGTASATPGDADVHFGSDGAAVFNEQGASVDFRVESNTNENALLVKGSTDQVLILSGGGATGVNESSGADVNFFVSGTVGSKDSSVRGTSLFGGDLTISGTIAAGMAGSQTAITTYGNIIPASNNTYDLGSSANRFQNIYTGDLHLRNERGDWTIVEEEDYLCVVNNKSGQKFKMALIPIEE